MTQTEAPHTPAAFINAIREEGTKEEACDYLQKQWNENCALRAEVQRCHERLEITHVYRLNMDTDEIEPIEVPYEERATTTDGIECRDLTIELLEQNVASLRAKLAAAPRKAMKGK